MPKAARAAAVARALLRGLGRASARAGRRLYQMYLKPVDMFEEIKAAPDASGAALLLTAAFAAQTAVAAAALSGVAVSSAKGTASLLESFLSNLAAYVSIRGAALFVFWFILFIVFWFVMYLFGSRVEGFTVFSATGYILSSQLATFLATLAVYVAAARSVPSVVLVSEIGVYPQYAMLAAHLFRLESLHPLTPLLLDAIRYFGTAWNIVLTALMFKVVGDLSWGRAGAGTAIATVASWLLASIFRVAGML